MYIIDFYQEANGKQPIKEYIDILTAKNDKDSKIKQKKIGFYIGMLEKYGTRIGKPFVDKIKDDIWELRPSGVRIFFFWYDIGAKFILLHYFIKKTQKTPIREIEQALRNMQDYIKRSQL
ncbi:MAG: type II toxin-antitoxin system RelE/ParE family toxin [Elusimicrobiota bacterium]|jgi:phage-related protein|nr:type II toxin-antitoxin system RelE/ParE family toxin [Elusimicrobiota bacterium]